MSKRRLTAYYYLLIASLIWGIAGPIIKFTLFDFPPLIFLSYRFTVSALVSVIIIAITKPKFPTQVGLSLVTVVLGILTSTVTLGLLFLGFAETTSLAGTTISSMGPLFVALLGVLLLRERVTRFEFTGMLLAFIGTVITIVEPVLAAEAQILETTLRGNFFVVLSLIIGAGVILLEKVVLKKGVSASVITHTAFIVGFFTIVPLTLMHYSWPAVLTTITAAPLAAHLGVWYMALLSGTFAYWLHARGLSAVEAGEASLFAYLSPIWAAPLALFWLGETISPPFIIGCTIIALGVIIAEYRRSTRRRKRRR